MRRLRRIVSVFLIFGLFVFAGLLLYSYARNHPEDLPWTPLDLTQPVGAFTGRKLADLPEEGERCKTLLDRAGVEFAALAPRSDGPHCGYENAVRFAAGGARRIAYRPADLTTSCAVAAGLALWEWHVVQPAALEHFGSPVEAVEHFGSYSCRRMYGRDEGAWSQHATANAVDIASFRLEDGTRISVARDWEGDGAEAAFLREVHDGACRLFASVLSPDYNAAHRDHLHFDQARRGAMGWRACR